MKVTTKEAAGFFDVDKSTLTLWKQAGADAAYLGRNEWDLKQLVFWWAENIHEGSTKESADESLSEAKRLYWRAKAERERLRADQERGKLLPESEVKAALIELIMLAKKAFMLLPQTAPASLVGLEPSRMMALLQQMTDEILNALAEGADIETVKKKLARPGK